MNKNPATARKGSLIVQRGHACSHTSSGPARALSSQGEKKKAFVQPGVQTEQTEHQDQARAVLSSQHLSAKEKATHAHLLTCTHLLRRGHSITGITDTTGNMVKLGKYLRKNGKEHGYCTDHNLHLVARPAFDREISCDICVLCYDGCFVCCVI